MVRLNPLSDTEAVAANQGEEQQMAWETAMAIKVPSLALARRRPLATLIPARASTIASRPLVRNGGNQFHLLMDFGKWFGWVARVVTPDEVDELSSLKSLKVGIGRCPSSSSFGDRIDFWPITAKARAMKKMQVDAKMMPEIFKIREKYKNLPEDEHEDDGDVPSTASIVSQIGGCLPMLIRFQCSSASSPCCEVRWNYAGRNSLGS